MTFCSWGLQVPSCNLQIGTALLGKDLLEALEVWAQLGTGYPNSPDTCSPWSCVAQGLSLLSWMLRGEMLGPVLHRRAQVVMDVELGMPDIPAGAGCGWTLGTRKEKKQIQDLPGTSSPWAHTVLEQVLHFLSFQDVVGRTL